MIEATGRLSRKKKIIVNENHALIKSETLSRVNIGNRLIAVFDSFLESRMIFLNVFFREYLRVRALKNFLFSDVFRSEHAIGYPPAAVSVAAVHLNQFFVLVLF